MAKSLVRTPRSNNSLAPGLKQSSLYLTRYINNPKHFTLLFGLQTRIKFSIRQVDVNGPSTAPIYDFLKSNAGGFLGGLIKWNFEKFLVDKKGKVVERYPPTTSPFQIEVRLRDYFRFDYIGLIPGFVTKQHCFGCFCRRTSRSCLPLKELLLMRAYRDMNGKNNRKFDSHKISSYFLYTLHYKLY